MGQALYLLTREEAVLIEENSVESEDELQRIIKDNPNILLREEDRQQENQLHLICRELPLPGLYAGDTTLRLDHFMVDNNAVPALVEVKLVSNPECRRSVIGQMIDYASRITYYDSAELREMYKKNNPGEDAPVEDAVTFWRQVYDNLRAGHIRMIFAANEFPNSLKPLIQCLDRNMPGIDVYGVEIVKHRMHGREYLSVSFVQDTTNPYAGSTAQTAKAKWSDKEMLSRLNSIYGEAVADFFMEFKQKAIEQGFVFKYGNASYINADFYWRGVHLFGIHVDELGGSIYFKVKPIASLTNGEFPFDRIRSELEAIDPNAKYTKDNKPAHLRTRLKCYAEQENRESIFAFLGRIRTALQADVV